MIDDLDDLVKSAVTEVFDTMLKARVVADPPGTALLNGEAHVASAVGFIGTLTGVVYIYASDPFARHLTSVLLGLADDAIEGDEMANDAMGELANMVVGHLKSRLADRGMPCVLTIPSIVRGSNFTIEAVSSTTRRVNSFRCDQHQITLEILIKPSTSE
jgi:chemotaxis protein CheX